MWSLGAFEPGPHRVYRYVGCPHPLPGLPLLLQELGAAIAQVDPGFHLDAGRVTAGLLGVFGQTGQSCFTLGDRRNLGNQPSASRAIRRSTRSVGAGSPRPPAPIQMGMGRCTGRGLMPAWVTS